MTGQHLHIVCFDVPYPPDYGGIIPVFYELKAISGQGISIHLHCFEYGRPHQKELEKFCTTVQYYERKTGLTGFSPRLPYIVSSRINESLFKNLLSNDYPILLHGIHCSFLIHLSEFKGRKIILRLHNAEFQYYNQLARDTNSLRKSIYYKFESRLLRRYEPATIKKTTSLVFSEKDLSTFQEKFGVTTIHYLPPIIQFEEVKGNEGFGKYCLYHGNLSVAENELAAKFLIQEVFKGLPFQLIIAGKDPSSSLQRLCSDLNNVKLIINPSDEELQQLISEAHINILPSTNGTGVKLKLVNALFNGRHCLVNEETITQSELREVCRVAKDCNEFRELVEELFQIPFSKSEIENRGKILRAVFDNQKNVRTLLQLIY